MSGHTPGPWTVDEASERGGYWIAAGVIGENRYCVIAGRGDWDHRAAESLANARLIAAAPEMLAYLKRLREAVVRDESPSLVTLDEVIAKAEASK